MIAYSQKIPGWSVDVLERQNNWITCKSGDSILRLDSTRELDRQILCWGTHEKKTTDLVKKIVKPGMTVVDVGANFGFYTVMMSKLVGSSGQVLAFEPLQIYWNRLEYHINKNGCTNVIVEKRGLSNNNQQSEIFLGSDTATIHWPANQPPSGVQKEIVELVSLDFYLREKTISRLDFIKVDIDGHEPYFFQGAAETISKFKPSFIVVFAGLNLLA
jgi:FkbM family methyltransferase